MKIIALDPSVNNVGWATCDLSSTPEVWGWGTWQITGFNFQGRCYDVACYIRDELGEFDDMVIEWPMFYNSEKGAIAATQNYTIQLAGIAMYVAGYFQKEVKHIHLYTAPKWKGQVSKAVTARRFFKEFEVNPNEISEHAIDAAMMLLYHIREQKLLSI